MLGCKPIDTPMDPNLMLGETICNNLVEKGRYRCLVGILIYFSHTRPDIPFHVSCVSQFMHASLKEHMAAIYRILTPIRNASKRPILQKNGSKKHLDFYRLGGPHQDIVPLFGEIW